MKDTCIIYRDFRNAVRHFSPQQRAAFYEMIMDYVMDDVEPPPQSEFISHFELIRSRIDNDVASYASRCQINSENGKKGGAPKGNQNARKTTENKQKQPKTSETSLNDNDNVNDNNAANTHAHARESFCERYGIIADVEPPPAIDFDKIALAYSQSTLLQNPDKSHFRKMSWIVKNYEKIISGAFVDYAKEAKHSERVIIDKSAEELNAAFANLREEDL